MYLPAPPATPARYAVGLLCVLLAAQALPPRADAHPVRPPIGVSAASIPPFAPVALFSPVTPFPPTPLPGAPDDSLRSLLIVHTNDLHDRLRPGYDGVGGLAYVAGHIARIKSRRDDVLVFDAGDVAEKGDLVARRTRSRLTFEAMRRIGYDAWTPGNHDHDFGIQALREFTAQGGMAIANLNLLDGDGEPEFPTSLVLRTNGLRVGVIGAIVPRDTLSLDAEGTARAIARESAQLAARTDLVVALIHIPTREAAWLSTQAPEVDVFITGHSHEVLEQPAMVPGTGALIVQAGSYARYVGSLDLQVDTRTGRIASHHYQLAQMDHRTVQPDLDMLEWIRREELALTPEAQTVATWLPRPMGRFELGIFAAHALRVATGSDVALHKSNHIVRDILHPGLLDLNAVYRTGGERGERLVQVRLTGREIEGYLRALPMGDWLPTNWSGFTAVPDASGGFATDLDPDRLHTVTMPEREWIDRFQRIVNRVAQSPGDWPGVGPFDRPLRPEPLAMTWIEAVGGALDELRATQVPLPDVIRAIADSTGQSFFLDELRDPYLQGRRE